MGLPREFKQLEYIDGSFNDDLCDCLANFHYKDEYGEAIYMAHISRGDNLEIEEVDDEFVNGFKRVKFKGNLYSFIRERDGQLMPHEFYIASNFNEHGFAMVGRANGVAWINKDFDVFLDDIEEWVPVEPRFLSKFAGCDIGGSKSFKALDRFSQNRISMSQLMLKDGTVCYMNTLGQVVPFYLNGGNSLDQCYTCFNVPSGQSAFDSFDKTRFNGDGYALRIYPDGIVLFEYRAIVSVEQITEIAASKGILTTLNKKSEFSNLHRMKMKPIKKKFNKGAVEKLRD